MRDAGGGRIAIVEHMQAGTRLSEGLADGGALDARAAARTLAAARDFAARAREHGAELRGIATSALRRAGDRDRFAECFARAAGCALEVLPGTTEARASFVGATYGAARDGVRTAVLDIGGGSTECAVGRDGMLEDALSIELGSVRISDAFPRLLGGAPGSAAHAEAALARAAIAAALEPLRALGDVARVRCVAGTPLTLGAVALESHVDRVSGEHLPVATIAKTLDRLLDLGLEERRTLPGMLPQRADIVVGGGLILMEALRILDVSTAELEANDLLLGYLVMTGSGAE